MVNIIHTLAAHRQISIPISNLCQWGPEDGSSRSTFLASKPCRCDAGYESRCWRKRCQEIGKQTLQAANEWKRLHLDLHTALGACTWDICVWHAICIAWERANPYIPKPFNGSNPRTGVAFEPIITRLMALWFASEGGSGMFWNQRAKFRWGAQQKGTKINCKLRLFLVRFA